MGKVTKVIITIETDNDAFEEARESNTFDLEVKRVIATMELNDGHKFYDYNGNFIGDLRVETE